MDLRHFLAMTGGEFALCGEKPENIAWMACHFSPYGTGLSNLPQELPKGSMLILNDRIPICGHDPLRVADELAQASEALACDCILLDFQRRDCDETAAVVDAVLKAVTLPVGVSDMYAAELSCPVFLCPPPLTVPLADHTTPWQGREIWLETALDAMQLTVTQNGSTVSILPYSTPATPFHRDSQLHCTYQIELQNDAAIFRLYRTVEDLSSMLAHAENCGITKTVGLFQQFA